jgi:hypothetical protein
MAAKNPEKNEGGGAKSGRFGDVDAASRGVCEGGRGVPPQRLQRKGWRSPGPGDKLMSDAIQGNCAMSLVEELRELEELRQRGTLSEEEFAAAKQTAIARQSAPPGSETEEQLAALRRLAAVKRIDEEWSIESERHLATGARAQPSFLSGLVYGLLSVAAGLTAAVIPWSEILPDNILPIATVIAIVIGIGIAIYYFRTPSAYDEAYASYQQRRDEAKRAGKADKPAADHEGIQIKL